MIEKDGENWFYCDCHTEGILVESDEDTVDVAFYRLACNGCNRLRHIWQILRYGHPYEDMVCLSPETAEALGKCLMERAGEARENVRGISIKS